MRLARPENYGEAFMTTSAKVRRGADRPLWKQIHDALLDDIRAGRLEDAGRLPPAGKIAERFGVNRHTVRQALRALDEAGVTVTRQGAGSYVAGHVVDYPISEKTRFSDIVLSLGMAPSGQIVQIKKRVAGKVIAEALQISARARIVLIERIVSVDDRVIGVGRHHFAAERFPEIGETVKTCGGITAALERNGVGAYFRQSTMVAARMPSAREARLLSQRPSEPVLFATAINVDSGGSPIEYGETLFAAGRVRLRFDEIRGENGEPRPKNPRHRARRQKSC